MMSSITNAQPDMQHIILYTSNQYAISSMNFVHTTYNLMQKLNFGSEPKKKQKEKFKSIIKFDYSERV